MKRSRMPSLVIFTDLDGTLLDLQTYSFQQAGKTLSRVKAAGIPLVFCSSKTRAELEHYQEQMGIRAPMIAENGSAIYVPEGYFGFDHPCQRPSARYTVVELGIRADAIRQRLKTARDELNLRFRGYAEMSFEEICRVTGLDRQAAIRARSRNYSETIVGISVSEAERLNTTLAGAKLSCAWGSRFCTVASSETDKGKAVKLLSDLFRRQDDSVTTVGLGDAANDAALLAAVDKPFLIQKPDGRWESVDVARLEKVEGAGPAGWNRIIGKLLDTA